MANKKFQKYWKKESEKGREEGVEVRQPGVCPLEDDSPLRA